MPTVTEERAQVVDFGPAMSKPRISFLVRKKDEPEGGIMEVWAFIKIFSVQIWIWMAGFVLVMAVAFLAIANLVSKEAVNTDSERFSIMNSIAMVCLLLVQKEYPLSVSKKSSRTLYLTLLFGAFLLFSYYSAFLTSLITAKLQPEKIKSFKEIFDLGYKV